MKKLNKPRICSLLGILSVIIMITGCSSSPKRMENSNELESQVVKYKYQVQYTAEATEEAPTDETLLHCAGVIVSEKPLTEDEVKSKVKEEEAQRTDIVPDSINVWQIDQIAP